MDRDTPFIQEVKWDAVQKAVAQGSERLASIIDTINPDKDLSLIHVRYPFGSVIVNDGVLHLPLNKTTTVPLHDEKVPKILREKLAYSFVPLGMIIKNSLEIYREMNEKVFSVDLSGANTGIEIGIVEHFGSSMGYTVTSGARSLFMVPKISNLGAHKRLCKEFGITVPAPKRIIEHWNVFRALYNSEKFESAWECEMLFLTKKWFECLKKKDPAWLELKNYLHEKGWEHSELGRRKIILDVLWEQASELLVKKSIKPEPYIVDTLKQIVNISLGNISGSRPANGDNFAGPLNEIQKVYVSTYRLDQIPTIMRPYNFNAAKKKDLPVYYSIQSPMLLSSTPNTRYMSSNIDDMRELINIKNLIFEQDYGNLKVNETRVNDLLAQIKLEYFHAGMYAYGKDIRPTVEMPNTDPELLYMPGGKRGQTFADNGSYIRGCVKISKI